MIPFEDKTVEYRIHDEDIDRKLLGRTNEAT